MIKSFLSLFYWENKSKRNHFLRATDSHEASYLPVLAIWMIFLNKIESKIKSYPITIFFEIILHFWSYNNHKCRQFIHIFIKRITSNLTVTLIEGFYKCLVRYILISDFFKEIIKLRLIDFKLIHYQLLDSYSVYSWWNLFNILFNFMMKWICMRRMFMITLIFHYFVYLGIIFSFESNLCFASFSFAFSVEILFSDLGESKINLTSVYLILISDQQY